MPTGVLLRVWDVYFAVADPVDLHTYVGLAILTTCKEQLEELDQSEVRSMMLSLPNMDVDRVSWLCSALACVPGDRDRLLRPGSGSGSGSV
jgi:hypothetical protein